MLPTAERSEDPPGTETPVCGLAGPQARVQEWTDGSTYEGGFVSGLKHGRGKYTWTNGEYYEGTFYKDYRHGDGKYCWPTGHKFIGKYYLNRREGYGLQLFPDGATFQGLYHFDQRFGPGVVSYSDGRQDVGLWHGEHLLRLCTSVEESFSLKNVPEYASYMNPAASPTQADLLLSRRTGLLFDDDFILPPDIERYSTDGDHLPLPPGRRRLLDQHFDGELWEADAPLYQGYERDPLCTLPLQARMEAHIHKHSLQAATVGWGVASVLALNRNSFGSKGLLEVSSELLIQQASRGEQQAVSQMLQTGMVHPDVADSLGHTALIAATVNCHNDVIDILLNMGADIDKLNCEGSSALAVCHVLYYPAWSLHVAVTGTTPCDSLTKTEVSQSQPECGNSPRINHVDFAQDSSDTNHRPQTSNTIRGSNMSEIQPSEGTTEEICHRSSKTSTDGDGRVVTGFCKNANTERQQEEREEAAGGEREEKSDGIEKDGKESEEEEENSGEDESKQEKSGVRHIEESEPAVQRKECQKREKNAELGERSDELRSDEEVSEMIEEDLEKRVMEIQEDDVEQREKDTIGVQQDSGVARSIPALDGHPARSSVQETDGGAVQKDDVSKGTGTFDSAHSVDSFPILLTDEEMQHPEEVPSGSGMVRSANTQETIRNIKDMKTERHVRFSTLKYLLERGADPNASSVPMPALLLAIMAADPEVVRMLLLHGARTDVKLPPRRKGLYPLHVAAALPGPAGPAITELLLHTATDPDVQANDKDEICDLDKPRCPLSRRETAPPACQNFTAAECNSSSGAGGRTALHVACQRDGDYSNAREVVALLLSHRANPNLLWSGHSPLSLAVAHGNYLAVEELLKGGADPNIPLGPGVGSALCALANINYRCVGDRANMLEMLVKGGADILMAVKVGHAVGTAVDYAHYSFNQDTHIANTPYHALNMHERETFNTWHRLLSMMGSLLRQAAVRQQRAEVVSPKGLICNNTIPPLITEEHRGPLLNNFCYECGRSVFVKLTACTRCHEVFYCSRACKLKAWDERHKNECIRMSAPASSSQKKVTFASQKEPTPVNATLNPAELGTPLSATLKSPRGPKSLYFEEKFPENQVNMKENYSGN